MISSFLPPPFYLFRPRESRATHVRPRLAVSLHTGLLHPSRRVRVCTDRRCSSSRLAGIPLKSGLGLGAGGHADRQTCGWGRSVCETYRVAGEYRWRGALHSEPKAAARRHDTATGHHMEPWLSAPGPRRLLSTFGTPAVRTRRAKPTRCWGKAALDCSCCRVRKHLCPVGGVESSCLLHLSGCERPSVRAGSADGDGER